MAMAFTNKSKSTNAKLLNTLFFPQLKHSSFRKRRRTKAPTSFPTSAPTPATSLPTSSPASQFEPFNLGVLKDLNSDNIRLSEGLTGTIVARSGEAVVYSSSEVTDAESTLNFHWNADGADVFALSDGGYIYVSNSEIGKGRGGVYGLEFDSFGQVRNYKALLTGTNRNCNGGRTPWNTWVSCEEAKGGQCWQVDPTGLRSANRTVLGGSGGYFEAFAYDARNASAPSFYITEDEVDGALRRYRPPMNSPMGWNSLHLENGTLDYLEFLPEGKFRWTTSLAIGRSSAEYNFQNSEGIAIQSGMMAFVSKTQKQLFLLDLDRYTYTAVSTATDVLPGGGEFEGQPDHVIVSLSQSGVLILTEDSGPTPGMFAYDGTQYLSYFESNYVDDEVVGIAFSPDGKYLFAAIQRAGYLFQISRDDGQPFDGRRVLKFRKGVV